MRYLEMAETLRDRIAGGTRGALPSEAELGGEYGVSRVTVRRALELLREEGLVTARQGVGWFVAVDPVRQALGRVTTIEEALEAAGSTPTRQVLEFAFEPAPLHYHLYNEVIYVVQGRGILHIDGERNPLYPGACIHLPARTLHQVENTGDIPLREVAVFVPAGSPAAAYLPDGTSAYPTVPDDPQGGILD